MTLGIISNPDRKSLERVKGFGIGEVEFDINIGWDIPKFQSEIPEIKKNLQELGLTLSSIGRWGPDKVTADGKLIEEEIEISKILIDATAELGGKVFMTGCNKQESHTLYQAFTHAIEYFRILNDYAKEKGVRCAIYNCDWNNFIHSPAQWDIILPEVEGLGIKFDPSHAYYRNDDVLQQIVDYGQYFAHVHAKGGLKSNGQRVDDPPVGLGTLDYAPIMAALYAKGYQGSVSLEPHSPVWQGELGEAGIRYSKAYLEKLIF